MLFARSLQITAQMLRIYVVVFILCFLGTRCESQVAYWHNISNVLLITVHTYCQLRSLEYFKHLKVQNDYAR